MSCLYADFTKDTPNFLFYSFARQKKESRDLNIVCIFVV